MAIFHLNARIVSRGKGQSAVAKAAYNAHGLLMNENTGDRHDYRYKGEVVFSGIFTPKYAPDWVKELAEDRQALWSAVEGREGRINSQLAREIEIALPYELTDKEREWLVKDFVRENFVRQGMIADVAIHAPSPEGDQRNHHAHILLSMREITPDGFGEKMRELNSRGQLNEWREKWEHIANRYLERFGHEARIDHRTLEAQGIDREATSHVGPTATDFERAGVITERGNMNREIQERNQQRQELTAAEKQLSAAIDQLQRQLEREKEAEREHHAQEMRERNAAAQKTILEAWAQAPRDPIGFMIELNERDLYLAVNEKGFYVAVEKSGYAHRLPLYDMHEAIDAVKRENNALIIPTLEEQRAELREDQKEAWQRQQERRAAHLGATLYDRADMVSVQRDAMRHLKDARRLQEQRAKDQAEQQRREKEERERREKQEALRQSEELARQQELMRKREERESRAATATWRDPAALHAKPQGEKAAPQRVAQEPVRHQETVRELEEIARHRETLRQRQELVQRQEALRQREELARQQEAAHQREELKKQQEARRLREQRERQEREREERQRQQTRPAASDQRTQMFKHKRDTTEQTETKQRQASKKQSAMERAFNFRASDEARARSGDYERERER